MNIRSHSQAKVVNAMLPKIFRMSLKRRLLLIYMAFLTKRVRVSTKLESEVVPKSYSYIGDSLELGILNVNLGYLRESGWIESKVTNASFFQGEYYPWITFPAIDFLEKLELSGVVIVEFGAGASTAYFAKRSKKVTSYEFDSAYYNEIRALSKDFPNEEIFNHDPSQAIIVSKDILLPEFRGDKQLVSCLDEDLSRFGIDAKLILQSEFYLGASKNISGADLIFIDGGPRNLALILTARFAKESAIVVVDNSEQNYIKLGIDILTSAGFHEIPFAGLGPLNPYKSQTSFFVRNLEAIATRSKARKIG